MARITCIGVSSLTNIHHRTVRINDRVAQQKYGLHYDREGRSRSYRVYRVSYPDRVYLGAVIGWFNSQCWAFIPGGLGSGDRWYIAPTRFEAINACYNFEGGDPIV